MENVLWLFALNCWQLLVMMAPYLLLGIVAAGLLHLFVPLALIRQHLSAANVQTIFKAALLGTPLPLCSCSVIPLAVSLKNAGASKGAVLSFLIATPITGVDSIVATYGVFGWLFTLYRLFASLVLAIVAGLFTLLLPHQAAKPFSNLPIFGGTQSVPTQHSSTTQQHIHATHQHTVMTQIQDFLDYTLNKILKDLSSAFIIGIVLGAMMLTLMPSDWETLLSEHMIWTYLLMLLIAPTLYICATGSIPLAASLVLAGFSPGAAFILLSAGPATSTVTMSVVYKVLGRACFTIYLLTIVVGSLGFALLLDNMLILLAVDMQAVVALPAESPWWAELSAVILSGLLIYYSALLPLWHRVKSGSRPRAA